MTEKPLALQQRRCLRLGLRLLILLECKLINRVGEMVVFSAPCRVEIIWGTVFEIRGEQARGIKAGMIPVAIRSPE